MLLAVIDAGVRGNSEMPDEMRPSVPARTEAKIREIAPLFAAAMLALNPTYDFSRSKFANSDLNIAEIMYRAAVLDVALLSIRCSSTSC